MDGMETEGKKPSKPLLPEIRCAVDKKRRYVSRFAPRKRRKQKARSCDLAFCENAMTFFVGQLESDSHIDDFCPSLPIFRAECRPTLPEPAAAAFPSCTQSAANHPREQSRAIFCNRIAFLTTPCACSPDRPHRIWKTTRGTPRNRRARRRATAGRDRRTSPP